MQINLNQVIEQVGKDKGIDKEILIGAMEEAMATAARKKLGLKEGVEAQYNPDAGEIEVFQYKQVVENVEDPETQMTLDDASEMDPGAQIGDMLGIKVDTRDFGRIAAQTAKQVIIQRVKDAERENVYMDYKDRKSEVVNGIVQRFERGDIIVNLGRVEALLPKEEQVPRESYRPGDRVRAYILDVRRAQRGPQILLSRTHPQFLVRLFELEVPEVSERIVEIRHAAREPGERAKIAVLSNDLDVDPVGACVGMRGSRVQSVVQELRGERIDIIPWSPDPAKFVCNALSPAEISRVLVDEENQTMEVIVPDDRLSLAIGKKGQNVRLASRLTGWRIDVTSETKIQERNEIARRSLKEIPGIGEMMVEILFMEGYRSAEEVANASEEDLAHTQGISEEKARVLIQGARDMLEAKARVVDEVEATRLADLDGVGEKTVTLLQEHGIQSVEQLSQVGLEALTAIPGIGFKKAEALVEAARKALRESIQPASTEETA
jgi:transcription termination/antitermination protein NusA